MLTAAGSAQCPGPSPSFPSFKRLLPLYPPRRLGVPAWRRWGPRRWHPEAVCSGLGWQRTDGHPTRGGTEVSCLHLADAEAGAAPPPLPPAMSWAWRIRDKLYCQNFCMKFLTQALGKTPHVTCPVLDWICWADLCASEWNQGWAGESSRCGN